MSRCSARTVQRPGQHILSHVYAALRLQVRENVHSDLLLSERRLGGPLLQLHSMLQLSPRVPWLSRTARCLQSKRSMPRAFLERDASSDLCPANGRDTDAHARQGWLEHDPFRQNLPS